MECNTTFIAPSAKCIRFRLHLCNCDIRAKQRKASESIREARRANNRRTKCSWVGGGMTRLWKTNQMKPYAWLFPTDWINICARIWAFPTSEQCASTDITLDYASKLRDREQNMISNQKWSCSFRLFCASFTLWLHITGAPQPSSNINHEFRSASSVSTWMCEL